MVKTRKSVPGRLPDVRAIGIGDVLVLLVILLFGYLPYRNIIVLHFQRIARTMRRLKLGYLND